MPPETTVKHRRLRGHVDAYRCCVKSLIGSALVDSQERIEQGELNGLLYGKILSLHGELTQQTDAMVQDVRHTRFGGVPKVPVT